MQGHHGSSSVLLPSSGSLPSSSSQLSEAPSTSTSSIGALPTREEIFFSTLSGARPPPFLPRLASDPDPRIFPTERSLPGYIAAEGGAAYRLQRLRALWEKLPTSQDAQATPVTITSDPFAAGTVGKQGAGPTARNGVHRANPDVYGLTPERAAALGALYLEELARGCGGSSSDKKSKGKSKAVDWDGFLRYADEKEQELWNIFHNELDLDGNGCLDADEWTAALHKSGIELAPETLNEFIAFLTSSPHSRTVSFPEFRDFLLLMPRKASTEEIYRYYEVRKFDHDARGAARTNMEGDVSLSAEDIHLVPQAKPPSRALEVSTATPRLHGAPEDTSHNPPEAPVDPKHRPSPAAVQRVDHVPTPTSDASQTHSHEHGHEHDHQHETDDEEEGGFHLFGEHAFKFLLAGGIAGVVSRTATAPFDRLKVYLMTVVPEQPAGVGASAKGAIMAARHGGAEAGVVATASAAQQGSRVVGRAIASLYRGGGIRAFWVGNGLNTAKIFPESAIKFMSYETSKRLFAKYFDGVEDSRDISGVSRFISGGVGGITSQLAIYPIETLKTQVMSTKGGAKQTLLLSAQQVYALGGIPAFYRGLVVGLVGVFPYSAIDMSAFEALKNAYSKSTGHEEPGVLAMLAFGSISGSVGATAVYPLNLVRTRLQASGSSGHPQRYTGMMDVVNITYAREGWKGFYKGLVPTLAKVVPAVSISYVVYEKSKRALGVA